MSGLRPPKAIAAGMLCIKTAEHSVKVLVLLVSRPKAFPSKVE